MADFHDMRRKEREIPKSEAIKLLRKGEYGILSTWGEDGWPYGVPVSYVYDNEKIYFHGALEGHKAENLRYYQKASFTVVGDTHVLPDKFSTAYESVIAFGIVRPISGDEQESALLALAEKYCYEYMERAKKYAKASLGHVMTYCMEISRLTGKKRPE